MKLTKILFKFLRYVKSFSHYGLNSIDFFEIRPSILQEEARKAEPCDPAFTLSINNNPIVQLILPFGSWPVPLPSCWGQQEPVVLPHML